MLVLFKRELVLAFKQGLAPALGFLFLVLLSFVFGASGGVEDYRADIVMSLLWVGLLLAHLLFVPLFFEEDFACGLLSVLVMEIKIPALLVLLKSLALWVGASLPLVLVMTGVGAQLIGNEIIFSLFISASLASLGFVFINAFGAALTCGLRVASWLVPLLVLPFVLPLVIFGTKTATLPFVSTENFFSSPSFMLLSGVGLLLCVLSTLLAHFALKTED